MKTKYTIGMAGLVSAMMLWPETTRANVDSDAYDEVVFATQVQRTISIGTAYWTTIDDPGRDFAVLELMEIKPDCDAPVPALCPTESALRPEDLAVADVDGDGIHDVIYSINCEGAHFCRDKVGPRLVAALSTGQTLNVGREMSSNTWGGELAVCELDGEAGLEVAVAFNEPGFSRVAVYGYEPATGQLSEQTSRFSSMISDASVNDIACADIHGLGIDELFARTSDGIVSAYSMQGRNLFQSTTTRKLASAGIGGCGLHMVEGNFDDDIAEELALACPGGSVAVLNGFGNVTLHVRRSSAWSTPAGGISVSMITDLATGDVDGDGVDEIALGGYDMLSHGGEYAVLRSDLSAALVHFETPFVFPDSSPGAVAFGNIDDDAAEELAVAVEGDFSWVTIHDDALADYAELQKIGLPARGDDVHLALRSRRGERRISPDGCCSALVDSCTARPGSPDPACAAGTYTRERVNRCGPSADAACEAFWGSYGGCQPDIDPEGEIEIADGLDQNCDGIGIGDEFCDGVDNDHDGQTDEDAGSCVFRALFIPVCFERSDVEVSEAVDRWTRFFESRSLLAGCGIDGMPKRTYYDVWSRTRVPCVDTNSDALQAAREAGLDARNYDTIVFVRAHDPGCVAGRSYNAVGLISAKTGGAEPGYDGEYVVFSHEVAHLYGLGEEYAHDVGEPNEITAALGCDPATCCDAPYGRCGIDTICLGNRAADAEGYMFAQDGSGGFELHDPFGNAVSAPPLHDFGRCVMTNASGVGWNVGGDPITGEGTERAFCPLCLDHWKDHGPKCAERFEGSTRRAEASGSIGGSGFIQLDHWNLAIGRIGPSPRFDTGPNRIEIVGPGHELLGSYNSEVQGSQPGQAREEIAFWLRAPVDEDVGQFSLISYVDNAPVYQLTPGGSSPQAVATAEIAQCEGGSAQVTLDGTASFDPDGDTLRFAWDAGSVPLSGVSTASPAGVFPLGVTPVILTVADGTQATSTDALDVAVADTLPPVFAKPPPVELCVGEALPFPEVTDACSDVDLRASFCQGPVSGGGVARQEPFASGCLEIELVARKTYAPSTFFDAEKRLGAPIYFTMPDDIPVLAGNSGNHWITAAFRLGDGARVECRYRGGASQAHPNSDAQRALGQRYVFDRCTDGTQAGDVFEADYLALHLDNGDSYLAETKVRWVLRQAELNYGAYRCGQPVFTDARPEDALLDTPGDYVIKWTAKDEQGNTICRPQEVKVRHCSPPEVEGAALPAENGGEGGVRSADNASDVAAGGCGMGPISGRLGGWLWLTFGAIFLRWRHDGSCRSKSQSRSRPPTRVRLRGTSSP